MSSDQAHRVIIPPLSQLLDPGWSMRSSAKFLAGVFPRDPAVSTLGSQSLASIKCQLHPPVMWAHFWRVVGRGGIGVRVEVRSRVTCGYTPPPLVLGAPSGPCWLIRPGAGISGRAVGVQLRQMRSLMGTGSVSPVSICSRAGRAAMNSSRMNAVVLIRVVDWRPTLEFQAATTDAMIVDIRTCCTPIAWSRQPQ